MCVILIGKVSEIRKVGLDNAWACNPDGAGFAYPDNRGKVRTIKGLMTLDALLDALGSVSRSTKIALHLRLATHGSVTQSNTHPFPIGRSGTVLMHNGILRAFGKSGTSGVSDSADLARVLGDIKDPKDRRKIIDSLNGMFAIVDERGIKTAGSRHWIHIGRGGVVASNDYFVPSRPKTLKELYGLSDSQDRENIWNWKEGTM